MKAYALPTDTNVLSRRRDDLALVWIRVELGLWIYVSGKSCAVATIGDNKTWDDHDFWAGWEEVGC